MKFRIDEMPSSIRPLLEAIDLEVGDLDGTTSPEKVRSIGEPGEPVATLWEAFDHGPVNVGRDELELMIHDHFIKPTTFRGRRRTIEYPHGRQTWAEGGKDHQRDGTRSIKLRKLSDDLYHAVLGGVAFQLRRDPKSGSFEGGWSDDATAGNRGRKWRSAHVQSSFEYFKEPGRIVAVSIREKEGVLASVKIGEHRAFLRDGQLIQGMDHFNGEIVGQLKPAAASFVPEGIAELPQGPVGTPVGQYPRFSPMAIARGQDSMWTMQWWSDADLRSRYPKGIPPAPAHFRTLAGQPEALKLMVELMARSRELARPRDPRLQVLAHETIDVDVKAIAPFIEKLPPTEESARSIRRFALAYGIEERRLKLAGKPMSKWLPSKRWKFDDTH